MAVGHAEDVIGLIDQFGREHAAALAADVDAEFAQGADGVDAGSLAFAGAYAGGKYPVIVTATGGMTKQPLSHGAATNIARANEQDGLHSYDKLPRWACVQKSSMLKIARQSM